MSKKDSQRESLRYLETPTAAFPIGSLGLTTGTSPDEDEDATALRNLVDELDRDDTPREVRPPRRVRRPVSEDETETEVRIPRTHLPPTFEDPAPNELRVQPALAALALLGGGILAVGVVAVFGMWLLDVN